MPLLCKMRSVQKGAMKGSAIANVGRASLLYDVEGDPNDTMPFVDMPTAD